MLQIIISETGRNSLKDNPSLFNTETETVNTIEEVKEFLSDRYGKMPNGRKKIYRDKKDGSVQTVGFLHSFWNKDCSHNTKHWYQTDWIEIIEVEHKPVDVNAILS